MTVTLVAGLPGAGKSTWAHRNFQRVLEFDDIALRLGFHEELDDEDKAFAQRQFALLAASGHYDAVVDVFMSREARTRIVNACSGKCSIVMVATPLETCRKRNLKRLPLKVCDAELVSVALQFEPICESEGFEFIKIIDNSEDNMEEGNVVYLKIKHGKVYAYGDKKLFTGSPDAVVSVDAWDASGGSAEVVEGRIVLGDPEQVAYERNAQIIRNERYIRMKPADRISPMRWEKMTEAKREEWRIYRQALLDIPQQPGFPWGGDPGKAPWPIKPE